MPKRGRQPTKEDRPKKRRKQIENEAFEGLGLQSSDSDEDSTEEKELRELYPEEKARKERPLGKREITYEDFNSATNQGQLFDLIGKSEKGKSHFGRCIIKHGLTRERRPYRFGLVLVRTKFKHEWDFLPSKWVIPVGASLTDELVDFLMMNLK